MGCGPFVGNHFVAGVTLGDTSCGFPNFCSQHSLLAGSTVGSGYIQCYNLTLWTGSML